MSDLDIQKFLPTRPGQRLLDGIWDLTDLSGLRDPSPEYGRIVFCLLMAALGSACMDPCSARRTGRFTGRSWPPSWKSSSTAV